MKILGYCFAASLYLLVTSLAQAGKVAHVRIFNLTDASVTVSSKADGFKSETTRSSELSGTIKGKSAFPTSGPVGIEESNTLLDSDLTMSFTSGLGTASIRVTYGLFSSYHESQLTHGDELYAYSAITKNEVDVDKGPSQVVINIFLARHQVTAANWMSQLRNDVSLGNLLIPGTHDTATGQMKISLPYWSTQELGYENQLLSGVRYFDLRFAEQRTPEIDYPEMVHGKLPCGHSFDKTLSVTQEFLKEHPTETVLFQLKFDRGQNATSVANLKKYIDSNSGSFYLGSSIPKLGDVRGKIVLVNRINSSMHGIPIHDGFPENGVGGKNDFLAQDAYEPANDETVSKFTSRKMALIKSFFDNECKPRTHPRLNLNYVSATFGACPPISAATGVNNGGDSINVGVAKYFNSSATLPYLAGVMLIDGLVKKDGLSKTAYLLNYAHHGLIGFGRPSYNTVYRIRPKIAPEKVLTIDRKGQKETFIHSLYTSADANHWQHFKLEQTGEFGLYSLNAVAGPPHAGNTSLLYLDAMNGTKTDQVFGVFGGNKSNQLWHITQYRENSTYYRIQPAVESKYLDVIAGKTHESAPVRRYPEGGTVDNQLWILEKVEY